MYSTWNAAQRGKQVSLPCGVSDRYPGTQLYDFKLTLIAKKIMDLIKQIQ
jgi:hypothetical protein